MMLPILVKLVEHQYCINFTRYYLTSIVDIEKFNCRFFEPYAYRHFAQSIRSWFYPNFVLNLYKCHLNFTEIYVVLGHSSRISNISENVYVYVVFEKRLSVILDDCIWRACEVVEIIGNSKSFMHWIFSEITMMKRPCSRWEPHILAKKLRCSIFEFFRYNKALFLCRLKHGSINLHLRQKNIQNS